MKTIVCKVATAVKTGIKEINIQQAGSRKLKTNAFKFKELISHLWNNTLNYRQQIFWQYYQSKQISDAYEKLLETPRYILPQVIENEVQKNEIRTLPSCLV